MIGLLLILGCGLFNRLWGSAWFKGNKIAATALFGASVGGAIYLKTDLPILAAIYAFISAALYFFGRVFGHGIYFCCFNPAMIAIGVGGQAWINKICDKIVPNVKTQTPGKIRLWGFIGMTLRGLYYVPLIASFYLINLNALYFAIVPIFIGSIYALQYYQPQSWWTKQFQVPVAEYLTGALLGGAIYGVI